MPAARLHVLGVDDAPFRKGRDREVPIVGVLMEGADLVEGVAFGRFPVDGDDPAGYLASWVRGLRAYRGIQSILVGGVTIAGLGLIDLESLAEALRRPVIAVTRRDPADSKLRRALRAAGLAERLVLLDRSPAALQVGPGLFVAAAGITPGEAAAVVRRSLGKSRLPEPLRLAHLIASGLVNGESRGRV